MQTIEEKKLKQKERARRRRLNPEWLKKKKEYERNYSQRPEVRERSREWHRQWRKNNLDKVRINKKKSRHKTGFSKKYRTDAPVSHTKEYKKQIRKKYNNNGKKRLWNQRRNSLKFNAGELDITVIQLVYEDNIKKYGTLTCYLCENPIEFRKDCLEHKTPLSRGGTNLYDNLGVAHRACNSRKYTRTVSEFMEYLKKEK